MQNTMISPCCQVSVFKISVDASHIISLYIAVLLAGLEKISRQCFTVRLKGLYLFNFAISATLNIFCL